MRPTREITLVGLEKQLQSINETIQSINSMNEKMKSWFANQPETNDAEEEEQEREWLQKNDEDESESNLQTRNKDEMLPTRG